MKVTITRLYDDYAAARSAVTDLEAADLPTNDISLIASNATDWYDGKPKTTKHDRDGDGRDDRVESAEMGAGIGAVLAGGAGLLAGVGWVVTQFIIIALFEQRSWRYMAINCGYVTVYFALIGFILGIWR